VPHQVYWQFRTKCTGSATPSVLAVLHQVYWQCYIKMPHALIYLMFNWIFSLLSQFQLMYKIKFLKSVTVRSQSFFFNNNDLYIKCLYSPIFLSLCLTKVLCECWNMFHTLDSKRYCLKILLCMLVHLSMCVCVCVCYFIIHSIQHIFCEDEQGFPTASLYIYQAVISFQII
jgi:hypothetical protein